MGGREVQDIAGIADPSIAPNLEGYFALLGTILKSGAENPYYFRTPCGRYWCWAGGLDPAAMWRMAVKGRPEAKDRYSPLKTCIGHK